MKAILLAGGFGTRLKPLTNNLPKCLVPINGKPLLQIWLEQLASIGIKDILINTHYLSENINNFIEHSSFIDSVKLVYEPELLGTAGTILKNQQFWLDDDVLVAHADNLCICDFNGFIETHNKRTRNILMTLMTFETENPKSCGIIDIDDKNIMIDFIEKPTLSKSNLANAAVYVLSNKILPVLKQYQTLCDYDFSKDVLPNLLNKVLTWPTPGYLRDIGTVESYKQACDDFYLLNKI